MSIEGKTEAEIVEIALAANKILRPVVLGSSRPPLWLRLRDVAKRNRRAA